MNATGRRAQAYEAFHAWRAAGKVKVLPALGPRD